MSNEWRISKTTIEAEMLRLATLLSIQPRSHTTPARLAGREATASNRALRGALKSVAAPR
jgi:hypothetical protein